MGTYFGCQKLRRAMALFIISWGYLLGMKKRIFKAIF